MKILADRISSIIFLLSACVYAPQLSGATVDSGSINLFSRGSARDFSLSGTGFVAAGFFEIGNWSVQQGCNNGPCVMGSSLDVNGTVSGGDFGGGPATFGGIAFDDVSWGDILGLRASVFEVTGPPILLNHGAGTYTGTFSFKGELCGTVPSADFRHPCVVDLRGLTGSGQVSVDLVSVTNIPRFDDLFYKTATYTFDTVLSGVPEPSTIVLVASTAAMIFLGRRKMRGHKIL